MDTQWLMLQANQQNGQNYINNFLEVITRSKMDHWKLSSYWWVLKLHIM